MEDVGLTALTLGFSFLIAGSATLRVLSAFLQRTSPAMTVCLWTKEIYTYITFPIISPAGNPMVTRVKPLA